MNPVLLLRYLFMSDGKRRLCFPDQSVRGTTGATLFPTVSHLPRLQTLRPPACLARTDSLRGPRARQRYCGARKQQSLQQARTLTRLAAYHLCHNEMSTRCGARRTGLALVLREVIADLGRPYTQGGGGPFELREYPARHPRIAAGAAEAAAAALAPRPQIR